jgi:hypothetical protein
MTCENNSSIITSLCSPFTWNTLFKLDFYRVCIGIRSTACSSPKLRSSGCVW